jgi:hypothetical protein
MSKAGRAPSGTPIRGHALTKDGTEVPVEIRLSGWHVGPQSLIGARIRLRDDDGQADGGQADAVAAGGAS